ncbi:ABC transporter substrate-binding protein [Muribacter muris]|uniref:ABC transporter substrate-binding protein n=1 Tax=Muribacter muris TaxID=67855 RepID=A0A4Y9K2N8_9PAST|nr:Slam-dependent surface lipoprotein [Muribacter muris]MBF0784823.1 transferrin-binding protein-like solute binding protein [Muribacter muris]MBF0826619.1 transferrin-binding protein-like solute binding protein [Muribacter muris]TFV11057.1 ABC transporter substrate-binding protein [Muribacter muris]
MKPFKLTTSLLATLILTACGGGGGSSHSDTPKAVNPTVSKPTQTAPSQPTASPNTATSQAQPQPTTPNAEASSSSQPSVKPKVNTKPHTFVEVRELPKGEVKTEDIGFGTLTGYNNQYSFSGAWREQKTSAEIVVDTIKMPLAKSLKLGGLTGYALANTLEAAWNAGLKNPDREIFYFGDETPSATVDNLRGKATYSGVASRYDNVTSEVKNIGTSTLYADFDNKKLNGKLAIDGLWRRNISLKDTDIVGNSFKGKAVAGEGHLLRTVEGAYEGKFFGPNAEEIAGKAIFKGEAIIGQLKDLDTSFSATKKTK